ncbi:MAG TPA: aminotransferase, partial [Mycobacteriales bacterium]|nr:aminotransferase [Mycobacteriales bacterium]
GHPRIEVLGNPAARRLSIVSFVVRSPTGRYLHHNFVVALLNDLFGIQSRGGCSCAGPYGHRLLGIDIEQSHQFETEIARGCEGIKPGWVRVSFNYFISETVFDYVLQAVEQIAEHGPAFLPDYTFDERSGMWRHRSGPVEPPLRLHDVRYDPTTGEMTYPRHDTTAPESALAAYLDEALTLAGDRGAPDCDTPPDLRADFESLRWFELPAACLT